MGECAYAKVLAGRMREARADLVEEWLERIQEAARLNAYEVFPGSDLIDHMPILVDGIAGFVESGREISAETPVLAKAIELGRARYEQGFDASQTLQEYAILGNILFEFTVGETDRIAGTCSPSEILACAHRIFQSIAVIQARTTSAFLALDDERVRAHAARLQNFNRMVSHELRNKVGAAKGAAEVLGGGIGSGGPEENRKLTEIVVRNLNGIHEALEDLMEISHTDGDEGDRLDEAPLAAIVSRVTSEMKEFAQANHVRIDIADLPAVDVPAAVIQLALTNLLSNSVKYRDPDQPECWVRVEARLRESGDECKVEVSVTDNGLGVPEEKRSRLFEGFFRAHEDVSPEEGSGLGLSIVRETVEGIQGNITADFPRVGSVFRVTVPCAGPAARRAVDGPDVSRGGPDVGRKSGAPKPAPAPGRHYPRRGAVEKTAVFEDTRGK